MAENLQIGHAGRLDRGYHLFSAVLFCAARRAIAAGWSALLRRRCLLQQQQAEQLSGQPPADGLPLHTAGALVEVHGLVGMPEHNFKIGTVKSHDPVKGRYIIQMLSGNALSLLPVNLRAVSDGHVEIALPFDGDVIEMMVRFFYSGKIVVNGRTARKLLVAATVCDVPDLEHACRLYLESQGGFEVTRRNLAEDIQVMALPLHLVCLDSAVCTAPLR